MLNLIRLRWSYELILNLGNDFDCSFSDIIWLWSVKIRKAVDKFDLSAV